MSCAGERGAISLSLNLGSSYVGCPHSTLGTLIGRGPSTDIDGEDPLCQIPRQDKLQRMIRRLQQCHFYSLPSFALCLPDDLEQWPSNLGEAVQAHHPPAATPLPHAPLPGHRRTATPTRRADGLGASADTAWVSARGPAWLVNTKITTVQENILNLDKPSARKLFP